MWHIYFTSVQAFPNFCSYFVHNSIPLALLTSVTVRMPKVGCLGLLPGTKVFTLLTCLCWERHHIQEITVCLLGALSTDFVTQVKVGVSYYLNNVILC